MDVEIFHGRLTPFEADIYVRATRPAGGASWRLSGRIEGPICELAHTLPVSLALRDLGPGESLLAKARLPQPCFWSPDLPARYRVTWRLETGDAGAPQTTVPHKAVAEGTGEIGLTQLIVRGRDWFLDNRRWVVRAVHREGVTAAELPAWRESDTALVMSAPPDEILREASRQGVWILARSAEPPSPVELRRFGRYPCVLGVIQEAFHPPIPTDAVPNLRAGRIVSPNATGGVEHRTTFWVLEVDESWPGTGAPRPTEENAFPGQLDSRPCLLSRRLTGALPLEQSRAACDRLQADAAGRGRFAGYLV